MSKLFTPFTLGSLTLKNRIGVSPMCQYSAIDGHVTDWHLPHLGARAAGGAGLVIMEATAVSPEGRITPNCTGIWNDAQMEKLKPITSFIQSQDSVAGIQLAHAGRKASCKTPWQGRGQITPDEGGWIPLAPSPIPFSHHDCVPQEMTLDDIQKVKNDFVSAAKRAVEAGFQLIEIHGAHGYLLHSFNSPLSNHRTDAYGGSSENRFRLILEVTEAIKKAIPNDIVLGVRLSCTDWDDNGLTIDDTTALSKQLKAKGAVFIDCSSGFNTPDAKVPFAPMFQTPFSNQIKHDAQITTMAVGEINTAIEAESIIAESKADIVLLGRAMLRDPYWAINAAHVLGAQAPTPNQYLRGYETGGVSQIRKKA